jgi:hypothetical protein
MEIQAVPFRHVSYASSYTVKLEVHGLLRLDDDRVVVEAQEIRTNLATYHHRRGEVRTAELPLALIDSVELTGWWPWWLRLRLRSRSMAALAGLPGTSGGELVATIRQGDQLRAREFVSAVELELAERRLRMLETTRRPELPSGGEGHEAPR